MAGNCKVCSFALPIEKKGISSSKSKSVSKGEASLWIVKGGKAYRVRSLGHLQDKAWRGFIKIFESLEAIKHGTTDRLYQTKKAGNQKKR